MIECPFQINNPKRAYLFLYLLTNKILFLTQLIILFNLPAKGDSEPIETAQRKCCISYLCSCYLCTGVSILKPPVKFNLVECHKVELSLNTISQEPVSHQC